jgi:hypothetical protein
MNQFRHFKKKYANLYRERHTERESVNVRVAKKLKTGKNCIMGSS